MNTAATAVVEEARRLVRATVRRRWLALGVAAVAAVAWALAISRVPDRYEASARVYVDTQTVLKPLMAGLTFQPDIDQQVRMLARTLISRPNVEQLVQMPELQLHLPTDDGHEKLVSRLMDQIKVQPTASGNLFEIDYRGSNPESARRVVEATVDLFVHSSAGDKKKDSQDASRFIDEQIHEYEAKLTEAENRLKDFKVRNFGVTGVSDQDYFARMSVMSADVDKLRVELGAAEQASASYRRELAAEPSLGASEEVPKPATGPMAELQSRLDAQRAHLDEMLRRFTEAHPDVIGVRRVIAQLESELRTQRQAEERRLALTGRVALSSANPVYQKLRISLAESEAQVASLRSQLAMQQGRLDQVRALAGRVPQVEAELLQMNRDYDVVRKNYEVMVARRESASLALKMDESSQLAEFRVIEPPRVSPTPVFPGRVVLAVTGVFAALGLGVAAAVSADKISPTFESVKDLRALSGRPVLGSVALWVTPASQRVQRQQAVRFTAAASALVLMQMLWVAWVAVGSAR